MLCSITAFGIIYIFFYNKISKLQSTTKKKTLNPQWDEAFEFSIDESTFTGKKKPDHVRVEVWNWNLLSKDSLLGYGEIKFADLIRDSRLPISMTLEGVQQGEVCCSCHGVYLLTFVARIGSDCIQFWQGRSI